MSYTSYHQQKHEQYSDTSHLNARIALHQRFGTGRTDLQAWVFDHFTLPPSARILELGCGAGRLWTKNLHRLPTGWNITLSDFFAAMAKQTRLNLASSGHRFAFAQFDAQAVPFTSSSFDAVIANHMLYDVPNRQRTYAEVQRILKPGGLFYATTNSRGTMRQLTQLEERLEIVGGVKADVESSGFSLENGAAELRAWFPHVTVNRLEEVLLVTESQPLIDYVLSVVGKSGLPVPTQDEMRDILDTEIRNQGAFRIDKLSGLFIAENG